MRSDQTLHRLEAFSDIVIAFSLSQLAVTLQIPSQGPSLLAHPIHIAAFFGSFALVCAFWWQHHQLFLKYFVPDALSVVANFAFLACTVLVIYSQQVGFRYEFDVPSLGMYALSFGCAFGLLAMLFAKGSRDARLSLDDADRQRGKARALRLAVVAVGLLGSVALVAMHASENTVEDSWVFIPIALIALRIFDRRGQSSEVQPQ